MNACTLLIVCPGITVSASVAAAAAVFKRFCFGISGGAKSKLEKSFKSICCFSSPRAFGQKGKELLTYPAREEEERRAYM